MITAAKIILTEKHVALPSLWMRAFPNINYDCEKAQRRLLQMPVASLSFAEGCFIVEKRKDGLYDDTKREIYTRVKHPKELSDNAEKLQNSMKEFSGLLRAAPNSGERERMKHLMASSRNLSSRQTSKLGIWNLKKGAEKVVAAAQEINRVKSKHLHFAKIEQKVNLESLGRNPNFYLSDSSSSEDEYSERQDEDRPSDEDVKNPAKPALQEDPSVNCISVTLHSEKNVNQQPEKLVREQEHQTPSVQSGSSFPPERGEGKNVPELDVNSSLVLDILREVDFNWFSFVVVLEPKFQKHGYSQEVFDQFLCDFTSQLQNLGLSVDEFNLVEQSRTAYLSEVM